MKIRAFAPADGPATFSVFYEAVHEGAAAHYTPAQRAAWAPNAQMPESWGKRHAANISYVAEIEGDIVGFMTLSHAGHLDMAFVMPRFMGTGIGHALYAKLEKEAAALEMADISTDASHLARPFFERQGWQVLAAQHVKIGDQVLENFKMRKVLQKP